MVAKVQLDLFIEENEFSLLHKQIKDMVLQHEKMKRTLYSRHQDLSRLCLQLKEENENLKFRLDRLENILNKQQSTSNENLLEKLFQEAYFLSS